MVRFVLPLLLVAGAAVAGEPVYIPGTTEKVKQLTGEWDAPLRLETEARTRSRSGITGTDLGSSFEHRGALVFLFGDTWGRPGDYDAIARSDATTPDSMVLQFLTEKDGVWRPITIPGLDLAGFAVPSHGISVRGDIYIVFTGKAQDVMQRSHMVKSTDDGRTWQKLYDMPNGDPVKPDSLRFVNVWFDRAEIDGKPHILMFGSGAYRKSSPRLAIAEESRFPEQEAWRFFAGMDGDTPKWSPKVEDAAELFYHDVIGEFSCAWIPQLQRHVMLYNSHEPRGITMRTAPHPWGPFGEPQVIMDPHRDEAYGTFMHIKTEPGRVSDDFSDPGREEEWGGEYAPYLIPRFTEQEVNECVLHYTMSTWNPYQVVLMRSRLGASLPPEEKLEDVKLPFANWSRSSDEFFVREGTGINTFAASGDNSTGWMWERLPMDNRNRSLRFTVHGGIAEALLVEGPDTTLFGADPFSYGEDAAAVYADLKRGSYGRVVRRVSGLQSNEIKRNVNWDLRGLHQSGLVVVIIDKERDPWGFVSVSEMTLQRAAEPVPPQ